MTEASQATDTLVALASWAVLIGGLWLIVRGVPPPVGAGATSSSGASGTRCATTRALRLGAATPRWARCAGTVNGRGAA